MSELLSKTEVIMTDAIVFLGIQGSGKGTQAGLLAQRMCFQHINIGDLLRQEVSIGSAVGDAVGHIIERGDLVKDTIVFDMIDTSVEPGCKGIIFDGFPRTLSQAEHLVEHYNLIQVYYLELSEEDAIHRIEGRLVCTNCGENYHTQHKPPSVPGICDICGSALATRADDEPEAIAKRVKAFYERTFILKSFFEKRDSITSIPACKSVEEIQELILEDISKR
ncbi:MAG: nucleoside monophosphate kinase [Candidatus Cloacimonetes bacterium]|nr:nucleoside monophosphate kinase [Candidatus Cloacimonadota bacterium]